MLTSTQAVEGVDEDSLVAGIGVKGVVSPVLQQSTAQTLKLTRLPRVTAATTNHFRCASRLVLFERPFERIHVLRVTNAIFRM